MGAGGDGNVQETVVSYDGYGTNGSDAITVAYMEPSLVMNTTYSSIPTCTTSSLVFNPNHLDHLTDAVSFRGFVDVLRLCSHWYKQYLSVGDLG